MDTYEKIALKKVKQFESKLYKVNKVENISKGIQQKVDHLVPRKIHQSFANALEKGIKSFLQGVNLIQTNKNTHSSEPQNPTRFNSLHNCSVEADLIISKYKKLASVEGAVTGFGGIMSGAVDFPALLSIKLKLLQEMALIYDYHLDNFEERVFILKIFQLQFSGPLIRRQIWGEIKSWENNKDFNEWESWDDFNWEQFYMEYKQSIELRKLLQMIPGIGAVVGAIVNFSFLDELGETAQMCYELRKITEKY